MKPLPLAITVLALVAAAGCFTAPSDDPEARTMAQFRVRCPFTHRANDDPIVHRGHPGMSHSHDFMGNIRAGAFGVPSSAPTSCNDPEDRSGYWVPTLYKHGEPITPIGVAFYYRGGARPADVQPFPRRLKMIAGDARAAEPQDQRVTYWDCGLEGIRSSTVPNCASGARVEVSLRFPDCWNGTDLDSPDHKTHVAYAVAGSCPATHPVAIPALAFRLVYPIRNGAGTELANGPTFAFHGDFVNVWNARRLAELVSTCIHAQVRCG